MLYANRLPSNGYVLTPTNLFLDTSRLSFTLTDADISLRTFSSSELLLPDRLLLRVSLDTSDIPTETCIANWQAYANAVQTLLRVHGLDAHLTSLSPPMSTSSESSRKWRRDDELCKALITLNIVGLEHAFPRSGGRLESPSASGSGSGATAGTLWRELCALAGVPAPEPAPEVDDVTAPSASADSNSDLREKAVDAPHPNRRGGGNLDGVQEAFEDAVRLLVERLPQYVVENRERVVQAAWNVVLVLCTALGLIFVLVLIVGYLNAELSVVRQALRVAKQ